MTAAQAPTMIACRECFRVFFPPSLPDACPECEAHRMDYQDDPERDLWIFVSVGAEVDDG